MLRYLTDKQLTIEGFQTPFEAHLNPENKWVKLANAIPWDEFVAIYSRSLSKGHGRPSISPRLAVSALIIKHMERLDDRGVVAALEGNIYMQYFAGYPSFTTRPPFDPSLLVEMRVRMGAKSFDEMSVAIIQKAQVLIEGITAKGTSKKKKKADKKTEDPKSDLGGNMDDVIINSNIEETETGKTDGAANSEMVKGINEAKTAIPLKSDTENVIEISETTENIYTIIIKTHFPEEINAQILPNQGKLKIDATVADKKIKYPTDIGLLNRSREESERLIDIIYVQTEIEVKPRTYRKKARKEYLALAMKKKKTKREIRSIISKQLRYLKRNIDTINTLLDAFKEIPLSHRDLRIFWVIQHIYDQQKAMYDDKVHSHPNRIVNIYQPYVRPIPRGKDKNSIEFGAKIGVSEICGFSRIDHIGWEAYSESKDLVLQVENYKGLFGYYPEVVMADGAYLGKENRAYYLRERNIRHTGRAMGRPKQLTQAEKLQIKKERGERNHIEGKFGQAKNGYGLTDIRARRRDTSEVWIGGIWLAMNLKRYMSILPVVGLLAIIQMALALLCTFLGKITALGKAVGTGFDEIRGLFDLSGSWQLKFGGTPSWAMAGR